MAQDRPAKCGLSAKLAGGYFGNDCCFIPRLMERFDVFYINQFLWLSRFPDKMFMLFLMMIVSML